MTVPRLRLVGQVLAVGLVAALFALLVWRLVQAERGGVAEGDSAPGFTLRRLDADGELSLASLRGKVVVLNFWASWCIPCKDEAPVLERTWQRYGPDELVVVGATWKDLGSASRSFARRYGMTYPLVRDGQNLTQPYGIKGVPETYVIDRRGRLVGSVTGALNARDEYTRRYDGYVREALRS